MSTNIEPVVAHDRKSNFFIFFPEPMVSIETWCDFFLEIFFLTRQKIKKFVTVPRLVKNTQISVTDTLSKTSLC